MQFGDHSPVQPHPDQGATGNNSLSANGRPGLGFNKVINQNPEQLISKSKEMTSSVPIKPTSNVPTLREPSSSGSEGPYTTPSDQGKPPHQSNYLRSYAPRSSARGSSPLGKKRYSKKSPEMTPSSTGSQVSYSRQVHSATSYAQHYNVMKSDKPQTQAQLRPQSANVIACESAKQMLHSDQFSSKKQTRLTSPMKPTEYPAVPAPESVVKSSQLPAHRVASPKSGSSTSPSRRKRRRSLLDNLNGKVIFAKTIPQTKEPSSNITEDVQCFGSIALTPSSASTTAKKVASPSVRPTNVSESKQKLLSEESASPSSIAMKEVLSTSAQDPISVPQSKAITSANKTTSASQDSSKNDSRSGLSSISPSSLTAPGPQVHHPSLPVALPGQPQHSPALSSLSQPSNVNISGMVTSAPSINSTPSTPLPYHSQSSHNPHPPHHLTLPTHPLPQHPLSMHVHPHSHTQPHPPNLMAAQGLPQSHSNYGPNHPPSASSGMLHPTHKHAHLGRGAHVPLGSVSSGSMHNKKTKSPNPRRHNDYRHHHPMFSPSSSSGHHHTHAHHPPPPPHAINGHTYQQVPPQMNAPPLPHPSNPPTSGPYPPQNAGNVNVPQPMLYANTQNSVHHAMPQPHHAPHYGSQQPSHHHPHHHPNSQQQLPTVQQPQQQPSSHSLHPLPEHLPTPPAYMSHHNPSADEISPWFPPGMEMGGRFFYMQSYQYPQHSATPMHGLPTPQPFMPVSNEHYMMHPIGAMHSMTPTGAPAISSNQYYQRASQSTTTPPTRGPPTKIKISHPDTREEVNVNDLAKEALLDRHSLPPQPPVESEAAALAKSQMQQSSCKKALPIKKPAGYHEVHDDPGSPASFASDTSEPGSRGSSRMSQASSNEFQFTEEMNIDDDQLASSENPIEVLKFKDVTSVVPTKSFDDEKTPASVSLEKSLISEGNLIYDSNVDSLDTSEDKLSLSGQASELPIPDIVVEDLSEPGIEPISYPTDIPAFCEAPVSVLDTADANATLPLASDPVSEVFGDVSTAFNNDETYVEYHASQESNSHHTAESDHDTTSNHSNTMTPPLDSTLDMALESVNPLTVDEHTISSVEATTVREVKTSSPHYPTSMSRITPTNPIPSKPITTSSGAMSPSGKRKVTADSPIKGTKSSIIRYTTVELLKLKEQVEKRNRPFSLPQQLDFIRLKETRGSSMSSHFSAAHSSGPGGYMNGQMKSGRPPFPAMRGVPASFGGHPSRFATPMSMPNAEATKKYNTALMNLAYNGTGGKDSPHAFPSAFAHKFTPYAQQQMLLGQHHQQSLQQQQQQQYASHQMMAAGRGSMPHARGRGYVMQHAFPAKPLENVDPNRWTPGFLKRDEDGGNLSEEQKYLKVLERKTRGLLNKISEDNFGTIEKFFYQDEKYSSALQMKTDMIVRKSFDEPKYASLYARLTLAMVMHSAPLDGMGKSDIAYETIRKQIRNLIIKACENQFRARPTWAHLMHPNMTEEEYEDITKLKGKVLGNMRFTAELFNYQVLSPKVMSGIVNALLNSVDSPKEEDLECVIVLLNTAGPILQDQIPDFENWFKKINKIIRAGNTIQRIRFLLMDLVALKENSWKKPDGAQLAQQLKDLNIVCDSVKAKTSSSTRTSSSSSPSQDPPRAPPSSTPVSLKKRSTSPASPSSSSQKGWMQPGKSGSSATSTSTGTKNGSKKGDQHASRPNSTSSSPSTSGTSRKGGRNDSSSSSAQKNRLNNQFAIFHSDSDATEPSAESEPEREETFSEPEVSLPKPITPPVPELISSKDSLDRVKKGLRSFVASQDLQAMLNVLKSVLPMEKNVQAEVILVVFEYISELNLSRAQNYGKLLASALKQNIWTPELFLSTLSDENFIEGFKDFQYDCPALPEIIKTIFLELSDALEPSQMNLMNTNYFFNQQ